MASFKQIIKENLPLIQKELSHLANKDEVLNYLSNNRILFSVLKLKKGNEELNYLLRLGERQIRKLKKTLLFLNKKICPKCLVLVVRTNKLIPYITWDVDLFVKESNFDKLKELLESFNWKFSSHDYSFGGRISGMQLNAQKPGFLSLDIHQDFTWQKSTCVDKKILWEKTQEVEIAGVSCETPSLEVEFLLNCANIIFEKFHLTLLDFLYLETVLEKKGLDWNLIGSQTKKFGWDEAFKNLMNIINRIGEDLTFGNKLIFPYLFPKKSVLSIFWAKFKKRKTFDVICFLYYWYCSARYTLGRKKTLAYYTHWFKLNE